MSFCCVCEVMEALDISQTRASRNINILHDAGLLKLRKEGLWSMYSIEREDIEDYLLYLMEAMKAGVIGNQQIDLDRQRLMNMERIGPDQCRMIEDRVKK